MAFTVVAYDESQDTSATLTLHTGVADQHVTVNNDDILIPDFAPNLLGYFALGANITQAQLSSPSLARTNLVDISPLDVAAEPESPSSVHLFPNSMTPLDASEALRFLAAEDAAGAARQTAGVFLANQIDAIPPGPVRTIRFTGTATLTANAWSLVPLTPSQQLEAGRYAIVGMRATSAGAQLARLVIPGSALRPGCVGYDDVTDEENQLFRRGGLGVWGEFEHTFVPQAEFLSVSADTVEIVYLDLIKL